ncbi:LLM class flavin-dependent oxidoreductase [Humibacter sp. RRB41]|uniref:LLM class flavin-dependent oxidoreductase n=1 Tax=Humibacter sp. RRB41 TaxID=2919946 RepID=UPI001FA980B8|nr:LLM class flavin-dependent oxidoreductase [Humibacter sp. RRB41]
MTRQQHFGWFFSRGFGPQGWGRPDWRWGYDWTKPDLYQHSVRELEQAGLDLVIMEDAISIGTPETLDLRVRSAYGGPKHDPLLLAPYLFQATSHIGIVPTINAGATPPYLAARQAATLQHLSDGRFGINVVTDVKSARHFGLDELAHDAAYDRAQEWLDVVRELWHSWDDGAYIADAATGRFADGSRIRPTRHDGEYFKVDGPLNAIPFDGPSAGTGVDAFGTTGGDPAIVSPGGSGRGLGFAGANSDVQLALALLNVDAVRAYRAKVVEAAEAAGRRASDVKTLFVFKPEVVASEDEARRVVEASRHPSDDELRAVLLGQSSDSETDLTGLDLDEPLDPSIFGPHVSRGTINGLLGGAPGFDAQPLRDLLAKKARKGAVEDRSGFVGTAGQLADFIEELGEDAGNDGFIFSGDLHPVTVHRMLDDLVPELRRRGILRTSYAPGGLRVNLTDF